MDNYNNTLNIGGGNSDYNIIRTPSKTEFDNLVINSDLNGTLNSDFNTRKINAVNGKVDNISSLNIDMSKEMEVALREEIKTGDAKIICTLDNGKKQEYNIKVEKIYYNNNSDNKSMLIKVTDEDLLEKTGGIIQRNVRFSNNTKWKIYWCNNTCIS